MNIDVYAILDAIWAPIAFVCLVTMIVFMVYDFVKVRRAMTLPPRPDNKDGLL